MALGFLVTIPYTLESIQKLNSIFVSDFVDQYLKGMPAKSYPKAFQSIYERR
jgi:hypothetical protein